MLNVVLIIVALVGCGGLHLIVLGLMGRRVGEAPHCRRCRHDLSGLTMPCPCPECGRPTELGTQRGLRRRRPRPILLGLLLLAPAALLASAVVVAQAKGGSLLQWLPTGWLIHVQSQYGGVADRSAAFTELAARIRAGTLVGEDVTTLVASILEERRRLAEEVERGAAPSPWPVGASEVVLEADINGLLGDEERGRFALHSADLSLTLLPTIEPGELRLRSTATVRRGFPSGVGTQGPGWSVRSAFASVDVDGTTLESRRKHMWTAVTTATPRVAQDRWKLEPRPGNLSVRATVRLQNGDLVREVTLETSTALRQARSALDETKVAEMLRAAIRDLTAKRSAKGITLEYQLQSAVLETDEPPLLVWKGKERRPSTSHRLWTSEAPVQWSAEWTIEDALGTDPDGSPSPLTFVVRSVTVREPGIGEGDDRFFGDLDLPDVRIEVVPEIVKDEPKPDATPGDAPRRPRRRGAGRRRRSRSTSTSFRPPVRAQARPARPIDAGRREG